MATTALRLGMALIVAALVATTPATPAQADATMLEPFKVSLRLAKPQASRAGGFDWLAKRQPVARVTQVSVVASAAQIGTGAWICSPAGFGKRSRCYAN